MIYFIQAGHDGPIKIGVTKSDAAKRLRAIQTTAPHTLSLLGQVPGNRAQESAVHRKLSSSLIRGEWFSPTQEVKAFITSVLTANKLPPDLEAKLSSRSMRVMFVMDASDPEAVDPLLELSAACTKMGTQTTWALSHGIVPSYVSDVLNGRRDPSPAILDALGLEKVVTYRKKAKVPA